MPVSKKSFSNESLPSPTGDSNRPQNMQANKLSNNFKFGFMKKQFQNDKILDDFEENVSVI